MPLPRAIGSLEKRGRGRPQKERPGKDEAMADDQRTGDGPQTPGSSEVRDGHQLSNEFLGVLATSYVPPSAPSSRPSKSSVSAS